MEDLHWVGEGEYPKDERTLASQKALLADFRVLPGFPALASLLEESGFAFLPNDSLARIHRTCASTRINGTETREYSGYWLFASLHFRCASGSEELLLHLPVRGGSASNLEALLESIRVPDEFGSTLTVIARPSPSGPDARRQCQVMAVRAFSRTYPISRYYQRIVIPYLDCGGKDHPHGEESLFSIRCAQLASEFPH